MMTGDEYYTRYLILKASKVSVAPKAEYYYRYNDESITKAVSVKLFDILITNNQLRDLFVEAFGEKSAAVTKVDLQTIYGIMRCQLSYFRNKKAFNADEKNIFPI